MDRVDVDERINGGLWRDKEPDAEQRYGNTHGRRSIRAFNDPV
jgi:hypothetical protein